MFRKQSAIDRLTEERLYEVVGQEIKNDDLREGLWVKAFAEAGGDKDKAKARYIDLRIQSLKDEMHVQQELHQQELKKRDLSEKAEKASTDELVAYLRRQKIGVKDDGSSWLLAFNDGTKRLESLDELKRFVAEHKRRAEEEAIHLKFINSIKPKLRRKRYAVWYSDGETHLRNLENDHKQIFGSFDEFKEAVDMIIGEE